MVEKCVEFYPELMLATAIALFVKHMLYPYHFRERFPYDDPPDKFIGSFSVGELVQYIIQVISFLAILMLVVFLELPEETAVTVFVILACIWWILPRKLCKRIDGW